jgi:hypothetical protein
VYKKIAAGAWTQVGKTTKIAGGEDVVVDLGTRFGRSKLVQLSVRPTGAGGVTVSSFGRTGCAHTPMPSADMVPAAPVEPVDPGAKPVEPVLGKSVCLAAGFKAENCVNGETPTVFVARVKEFFVGAFEAMFKVPSDTDLAALYEQGSPAQRTGNLEAFDEAARAKFEGAEKAKESLAQQIVVWTLRQTELEAEKTGLDKELVVATENVVKAQKTKIDWATRGVQFAVENGKPTLRAMGTTFASSCGALTKDTWTHVAVTYAVGSAIKIYVDGQACGSSVTAPTLNEALARIPLYFGRTSARLVAGPAVGAAKEVVPTVKGGCGGGNPLESTSSDGKTLAACAEFAATLSAGMFSYNPPDQHCVPFTSQQCKDTARVHYGARSTYRLYDIVAGPAVGAAAEMVGMIATPRVWTTARTLEELVDKKSAFVKGSETGLLCAWGHDIEQNRVMEDRGAHGYDAVMLGGVRPAPVWDVTALLPHVTDEVKQAASANAGLSKTLGKPFYFRQSCDMVIDHVYHPDSESTNAVAMKKSIISMLSHTVKNSSEIAASSFYEVSDEVGKHGAVPAQYVLLEDANKQEIVLHKYVDHEIAMVDTRDSMSLSGEPIAPTESEPRNMLVSGCRNCVDLGHCKDCSDVEKDGVAALDETKCGPYENAYNPTAAANATAARHLKACRDDLFDAQKRDDNVKIVNTEASKTTYDSTVHVMKSTTSSQKSSLGQTSAADKTKEDTKGEASSGMTLIALPLPAPAGATPISGSFLELYSTENHADDHARAAARHLHSREFVAQMEKVHGESFAPISTLEVDTDENEPERAARRKAHPLFKGLPAAQVKSIYDDMVAVSSGDGSENARRARMDSYTNLVDVLKIHLDAGVGAVHAHLRDHLNGAHGSFHPVGSAAQAGHATLMNALGFHGSAAAQESLRSLASGAAVRGPGNGAASTTRGDTIKITVESPDGEDATTVTASSEGDRTSSWGDMHPTVLHLTQVALANLADVRDPSDETIAALELFAGKKTLPVGAPSWAVALRKHAVTVLGKLLQNLLAYRADDREEDIVRLEQWIRAELLEALGDLEDDGVYASEAHRAGLYSPAGERCQGLLAAIENSGDRFFLPLVAGILSRGDIWKKTAEKTAAKKPKAPLKLGMDFASAVIRGEPLRNGNGSDDDEKPVASESSSWRTIAPGAVSALRHMEGTHVDHLLASVLEVTPTDRGIAGSVTTQHMRHNALGGLEKRMPPGEVTERVASHVFDLKKWAGRDGLEGGYAKFFASVARTPHAEGANAATEAMRVMLQRAGALEEKLEAAAARAKAAEDARRSRGLALLEASAAAGRTERLSRALTGLTTASSTCAQNCSACGIASNGRDSGVQCGAPDAKYQKCIAATKGGRALPNADQSKKCGSKAAPGCWSTYEAEMKLIIPECKRGKCTADYALMKTEAEFTFGCAVDKDVATEGNKADMTTPAPTKAEAKALEADATADAAAMAEGGSDAFMAIIVKKAQAFLAGKAGLDEIKKMENALLAKLPTSNLKLFSLVSPEEKDAASFIEMQSGAGTKKCGQGDFDLECFATSLLQFPREAVAGFEAIAGFDFFQCAPLDATFATAVQENLDTEQLSADVLAAVTTHYGDTSVGSTTSAVIKSFVEDIRGHATNAITPLNSIIRTAATLASGTIQQYQDAEKAKTLDGFTMKEAVRLHLAPIAGYVAQAKSQIKVAVTEMKKMGASFGAQTGTRSAAAGSNAAALAKSAIIAAALKTAGERCGMPPTLVDTARLLSKIKKAVKKHKAQTGVGAGAKLQTKSEARAALRETIKVLVLESRLVTNAFAAFMGSVNKIFTPPAAWADTATKILADLFAAVRATLIKTPLPGSLAQMGGSSDLFAAEAKTLVSKAKQSATDGAAACPAVAKSECELAFAMVQQGVSATESFAAVMKLVPEEMSLGAAKAFGLALVKSVKEARSGFAEALQNYYHANKDIASKNSMTALALKLVNALQGDFGGDVTQKIGMSKFMAMVRSIEEDFGPIADAAEAMLDPTVNLVKSLGSTIEVLVDAVKTVKQFDSKVLDQVKSCVAKTPVGGVTKWGPKVLGKATAACVSAKTKSSSACKSANKLLEAEHAKCAAHEKDGRVSESEAACIAHGSACQWSVKGGNKAKYFAKVAAKVFPLVCAQATAGATAMNGLKANFLSLGTAVQTHLGKQEMADLLKSVGDGVGTAAMPITFVDSMCAKVGGALPSKDKFVKLIKDAVLTSPQVISLFDGATVLLGDSLAGATLLPGGVAGGLTKASNLGLSLFIEEGEHAALSPSLVEVSAGVTVNTGADAVPPCTSFQCIAADMVRIPMELGEMFKAVRNLDIGACLSFDDNVPAGKTKVDELVALVKSKIPAAHDEYKKLVSMVTVRKHVAAFTTTLQEAVDVLNSLPKLVIAIPATMLAALVAADGNVASITAAVKGVVDSVKVQMTDGFASAKALGLKALKGVLEAFGAPLKDGVAGVRTLASEASVTLKALIDAMADGAAVSALLSCSVGEIAEIAKMTTAARTVGKMMFEDAFGAVLGAGEDMVTQLQTSLAAFGAMIHTSVKTVSDSFAGGVPTVAALVQVVANAKSVAQVELTATSASFGTFTAEVNKFEFAKPLAAKLTDAKTTMDAWITKAGLDKGEEDKVKDLTSPAVVAKQQMRLAILRSGFVQNLLRNAAGAASASIDDMLPNPFLSASLKSLFAGSDGVSTAELALAAADDNLVGDDGLVSHGKAVFTPLPALLEVAATAAAATKEDDPCANGDVSMGCLSAAVLRFPLEVMGLLDLVRQVDIKQLLPLDTTRFTAAQSRMFLQQMRTKLTAAGETDAARVLSLDRLADLARRFGSGLEEAVAALNAVRQMIVDLPKAALEQLTALGNPRDALNALAAKTAAKVAQLLEVAALKVSIMLKQAFHVLSPRTAVALCGAGKESSAEARCLLPHEKEALSLVEFEGMHPASRGAVQMLLETGSLAGESTATEAQSLLAAKVGAAQLNKKVLQCAFEVAMDMEEASPTGNALVVKTIRKLLAGSSVKAVVFQAKDLFAQTQSLATSYFAVAKSVAGAVSSLSDASLAVADVAAVQTDLTGAATELGKLSTALRSAGEAFDAIIGTEAKTGMVTAADVVDKYVVPSLTLPQVVLSGYAFSKAVFEDVPAALREFRAEVNKASSSMTMPASVETKLTKLATTFLPLGQWVPGLFAPGAITPSTDVSTVYGSVWAAKGQNTLQTAFYTVYTALKQIPEVAKTLYKVYKAGMMLDGAKKLYDFLSQKKNTCKEFTANGKKNGGALSNDPDQGFQYCKCHPGWSGEFCKQENCKSKCTCKADKTNVGKCEKKITDSGKCDRAKNAVKTKRAECKNKKGRAKKGCKKSLGKKQEAQKAACTSPYKLCLKKCKGAGKKSIHGGFFSSMAAGEAGTYFQNKSPDCPKQGSKWDCAASPDTTKWMWEWRVGSEAIAAGIHASYDTKWDVTYKDGFDTPSIDALLFAGGAAYGEAFTKKIEVLAAFGKIVGKIDPAKCEEGEDQFIKMIAMVDVIFLFHWEFFMDAKMCEPSSPCTATFLGAKAHGRKTIALGSRTLFEKSKTVMCGPVPLTFTGGMKADLNANVAIAGALGRAEVEDHETKFGGYDVKDQKMMNKLSGELEPQLLVDVYGSAAIGIPFLSAGVGISVNVLDIRLPAVAAYNFNSKKMGTAIALTIEGGSGRLFAFAEIDLGFWTKRVEVSVDIRLYTMKLTFSLTKPAMAELCHPCKVACVYGVCDRSTGTSCHCADGYHGHHCDIPCPGVAQGIAICHGKGAKLCDDAGVCTADPEQGCRYEVGHGTYCKCEEPYFGGDCGSTYPGLVTCSWASSACALDETAKTHVAIVAAAAHNPTSARILASLKAACAASVTKDTCERKKVCNGNGNGIETSGKCDCVDGWFTNSHGECKIPCPTHGGQVCGGKGSCGKLGDLAHCNCEEGYAGPECQYVCPRGGMDNTVCAGNGQCHLGSDMRTPTCHCHGGFKGTSCEEMHDGPGHALALPAGYGLKFEAVQPDTGEGGGAWSIALWVQVKAASSSVVFGDILSPRINVHPHLKLTGAGTSLNVAVDGVTAVIALEATKTNDKGWYFVTTVAGDVAGKTLVYVNAKLEATLVAHPKGPISMMGTASSAITGMAVDELRIYDTALSRDEIKKSRDTLLSGNELGLQVYYMFDEAEADTVYDQANVNGATHNEGRVEEFFFNKVSNAKDIAGSWSSFAELSEDTRKLAPEQHVGSSTPEAAALGPHAAGALAEFKARVAKMTRKQQEQAYADILLEGKEVAGNGAETADAASVVSTAEQLDLPVQQATSLLELRSSRAKASTSMKKGGSWHQRRKCRWDLKVKYLGTRFGLWNRRRTHLYDLLARGTSAVSDAAGPWLAKKIDRESKYKALKASNIIIGKAYDTHAAGTLIKATALKTLFSAKKGTANKLRMMWVPSDAGIETSAVVGFTGRIEQIVATKTTPAGATNFAQLDIASDFHWQSAAIRVVGLGNGEQFVMPDSSLLETHESARRGGAGEDVGACTATPLGAINTQSGICDYNFKDGGKVTDRQCEDLCRAEPHCWRFSTHPDLGCRYSSKKPVHVGQDWPHFTNDQRCYLAFANTYPDLQAELCGGAKVCTTTAHASAAANYKGVHDMKGRHRAGAMKVAACLSASAGAAEQCPVNTAPWFSSGRVFEVLKYEQAGSLGGSNTKSMGLKTDRECASLCEEEPGCTRFSNDGTRASPGCVLTRGLNNCRCKAHPKDRHGKATFAPKEDVAFFTGESASVCRHTSDRIHLVADCQAAASHLKIAYKGADAGTHYVDGCSFDASGVWFNTNVRTGSGVSSIHGAGLLHRPICRVRSVSQQLNCGDSDGEDKFFGGRESEGHPWCYVVENEGCPRTEGIKYDPIIGHGLYKECDSYTDNIARGGTWRSDVAAVDSSTGTSSRIFTLTGDNKAMARGHGNRECSHCATDADTLSCIHVEKARKDKVCENDPDNQDFTNMWVFGVSNSRNAGKVNACKHKAIAWAMEQEKNIDLKALQVLKEALRVKKAAQETKRVARVGRAKKLAAQLGAFGPADADTWRNAVISEHVGGWSSANEGAMRVYLNDVLLGETGVPTKLADMYNTWTIDLTKHQLSLLKPGVNTVRVAASAAAGAVMPTVIFAVIKAEVKAANGYLDCDGKSTFAQVKYNAHPALAKAVKSDFSVEAWVKLPSAKAIRDDKLGRNTGGVVLSRGGNGAAFWTLYGSGKTGAGFRVNWADGVNKITGAAVKYAETAVENYNLPNDEWFHYAAVFDDMFLGVYINGQRVAEAEVPEGSDRVVAGYGVTTPLLVGAMDSARTVEDAQDKPAPTAAAGSVFWGSIDDVVVWNEARSGQQIAVDAATEQWGATVVANDAKKNVGQQDAVTPDANATPKQDVGGGSMPIMAFDFDAEAGDEVGSTQDTATMDSSSVDGTEAIKVEVVDAAITRIYHAKEKHVWKDCPGAQLGAGETDVDICGGTMDSSGHIRGRCVLSEGTPRCFCSNGFKGKDCTTVVCAPEHSMGICSSGGLDVSDARARGGCKENHLWDTPEAEAARATAEAAGVQVAKSLATPDKTGPGWCEVRPFSFLNEDYVGFIVTHRMNVYGRNRADVSIISYTIAVGNILSPNSN